MPFYRRRMRTNNVHFNDEFGKTMPIYLDDQNKLQAIRVAGTVFLVIYFLITIFHSTK